MFKDIIDKYETRVDVYHYITRTVLEILLRKIKYINTLVQQLHYTKTEKQFILNKVYAITTKIKNQIEQLNHLEYIVSDLTIGDDYILHVS